MVAVPARVPRPGGAAGPQPQAGGGQAQVATIANLRTAGSCSCAVPSTQLYKDIYIPLFHGHASKVRSHNNFPDNE